MTPASKFARSVAGNSGQAASSFIGFTWGPALDAFDPKKGTPTPKKVAFHSLLDTTGNQALHNGLMVPATPRGSTGKVFATPVRGSHTATPFTRPSTVRRSTAPRRVVSDREAMKELVNLVGMSARKRVIESGRKPRILAGMSIGERSSRRTSSGTIKELRFDMTPTVVPPDERVKQQRRVSASLSYTGSMASADASSRTSEPTWSRTPLQPNFTATGTSSGSGLEGEAEDNFDSVDEDEETETETEIPASPTPGPRPGSAMSMMSRRSQTPTVTMSYSTFGTMPSSGSLNAGSGAMQRRNSGSYLTVPSVYPEPAPPVHTPTPLTVTAQNPGHVRASSAGGQEEDPLSDNVFDGLNRRHTRLVEDISGIHKRLSELARQIG